MFQLRRRVPVVFLVAIGAVFSLEAGVAGASTHGYKSTVTIISGEGAEFTGKVAASNKKCRAGRTVKLYYEPGGGMASVVGTARTDASGMWSMQGSFTAGDYQAKVATKTVHSGPVILHCDAGVSVQARF